MIGRREEFLDWLFAEPGDVDPHDFLRMFGMDDLADSGDVDHALSPEILERFREELSELHFELITGKVDRDSQEYRTPLDAVFEPLEASIKIALAVEEIFGIEGQS